MTRCSALLLAARARAVRPPPSRRTRPRRPRSPRRPNAQQERMKICNEKATGKTGDDRKKFMSACLSGEEPKMSQQDKMKHCNAKAGPMKGDERKQFMSSCLSA